MLKADIGDILYIVIFAVLMLAGGLEKYVKAKRQQQQQDRTPQPPQSQDEYADEEEHPAPRQAPPQTLEEMLKRMLQPTETLEEKEDDIYPEEAQSLEVIPETLVRKDYYQPVVSQMNPMMSQAEKEAFAVSVNEEKGTSGLNEYEFDLRQAIISSEILNRKY